MSTKMGAAVLARTRSCWRTTRHASRYMPMVVSRLSPMLASSGAASGGHRFIALASQHPAITIASPRSPLRWMAAPAGGRHTQREPQRGQQVGSTLQQPAVETELEQHIAQR